MVKIVMFEYKNHYLRAINEEDLEWLAYIRNAPSTWTMLHTLDFTNSAKQKAWYEKSSLDSKQANYIFGDTDLFINSHAGDGRVGFVRMDEINTQARSIRVGGDISPRHRGKGYSKKMYELIFKFCFDYLNMNRIWLLVMEQNTIAFNLYKKLGFKEEGRMRQAVFRDGTYHDNIIMSILRDEWKKDI